MLEVLAPHFRREQDLAAIGGDPHAQFDILHARIGVLLVKSADIEKCRRPHGPAA